MRRLRSVAATAAVLVACAIGATGCSSPAEEPAKIVANYQQRVVDGDIEGALKLDGTTVGKDEVLLTNAAYARAKDRIRSFSIVAVDIEGDEAKVRVQTVQKSGKRLTRMALKRVQGRWKLLPASLTALDVQPGPPGIDPTLSGRAIPEGRQLTLRAFPGTYELGGTSNADVTVSPAEVRMTGYGVNTGVKPAVTPTAAAQQRVIAAGTDYVERCAALGDGATWPQCPFRVDTSDRWWTHSHWNVPQPPMFKAAEWSPGCGGVAYRVGPAGCWKLESEPFTVTLTLTGGAYEDWTGEPVLHTAYGWTSSLSDVEFQPYS